MSRPAPTPIHRRLAGPAVALVAALALVAGCSSSSSSSSSSASSGPASSSGAASSGTPLTGSITVSAAASLAKPFATIVTEFEKANPGAKVAVNTGSSTTLATQIIGGAPADVAAFADTTSMGTLETKGLLAAPAQVFARNQLEIVTKPGNPLGITTLADLSKATTVALCGATVPCGKYAAQSLTKAGVTIPEAKITRGVDAKATLAAVTTGDADAAIVYVTDATSAGTAVVAVPIAAADNVIATYPIAVIKASSDLPLAKAFEATVLGSEGQAVLRKAAFLAP